MSVGKRRIAVGAFSASLIAGALGATPAASAHDAVVESNPASGATVQQLPRTVELKFSGVPQQGFNSFALSKDGNVLFRGEPKADGRTLTLDIPDSVHGDPGDYTLGYQITSSDGHATRGSLEFHVGAPSEKSTPQPQQGQKGEQASGLPSWLLPLSGIVVLVGALAMAIVRYRNLKS